jgi:hypothetical protein
MTLSEASIGFGRQSARKTIYRGSNLVYHSTSGEAVLDPIQLLLYKLKLRYETVLSGTSSTLEEPVHTFAAVTPVM